MKLVKSEEIFHQKTDYKKIILRFLKYKHWFIISVLITMAIAFVINKYSDKVYVNRTTLLVDKENNNSLMNSDEILRGGMFGGISDVENELAIFQSYGVVFQAVQEMNLEVSYFLEENLLPLNFLNLTTEKELYGNSPIQVIMDPTQPQLVNVNFYIEVINDSTFRMFATGTEVSKYDFVSNRNVDRINEVNISGIYKFGEKITTSDYSFSVYLTEFYDPTAFMDTQIGFRFNNLLYLTLSYIGNLNISTSTTTSSIVYISLSGSDPRRITDFLNTLIHVYIEKSLEKKNLQAFNTIKFIDSRIADISDSLMFAENKLQNFRSRNQVMDLSFQGQQLYEKLSSYENDKSQIIVQQKYYEYIQDYLQNNQDVSDLLAPSSMEIQDPVLSQLINEMLNLNSQRLNYAKSNPKNLFIKDLDIQISNLKTTILENIDYNHKKLDISIQDIDSRISKISSQITYLPKIEREQLGMERQFNLNDAIYTFLLQKRAEAQIARASNAPDYEIIDEAMYFKAGIISPNTRMNYMIAIMIGLIIPFSIILIRDFLNNKVTDIKEVEELSDFPIVGHVLHNKTKSNAVIRDFPKSPIADSFRAIRTNLKFFAKGVDKMVILITSTYSGEGKSFCSVNIASVYALLGKKTVLLGFDLRRPALYSDLNLNNDVGISSYLIHNAEIDEIIQSTKLHNLDLIAAGPIPPNPMELIASERTAIFFEELRKRYDYIIIDSAPLGAIADSFLLFNFSDINLIVVRHNATIKDALEMNLKNVESKNVGNVALLVNDIRYNNSAYGYSYPSAYYSNDKRSSIKKKLSKSVNKKGKKVS